ncbi:MAG: TRZ/ATZ family hydrolase [Chromatiales bacterium]|nr:TRZ/ATZ family hydrolase [Chromatiales bacterium]
MPSPDIIVLPRWIIPMQPIGKVLENQAVVVRKGRIDSICSLQEARAIAPDAEIIERTEHVLLPGFINAHTHSAMSLLRGYADDLPLQEWLAEHIWPAEAEWVNPAFVRDGTQLAIAEMLKSGTTCFNDMYFFPDEIARIASETGIRASIGLIVLDIPSIWAKDFDEYLSKGVAVADKFRDHSLISTVFAPHSPYLVSEEHMRHLAVLADELDKQVHMHIAETADEVRESMDKHGFRPLQRVAGSGLLSSHLQAVHMTQINNTEIAELAKAGATVVHCPESNLKLASGICPITALTEAGVNVALGTDGAASNNDLDMMSEMRTAALLAKGSSGDATAMPAEQILAMATINGAKALGMDAELGSIEPGKIADMICIDLNQPATQPVYNPISQIIYAAGRDQVTDVWVAGKPLLTKRKLTTLDETAIIKQSKAWQARIAHKL